MGSPRLSANGERRVPPKDDHDHDSISRRPSSVSTRNFPRVLLCTNALLPIQVEERAHDCPCDEEEDGTGIVKSMTPRRARTSRLRRARVGRWPCVDKKPCAGAGEEEAAQPIPVRVCVAVCIDCTDWIQDRSVETEYLNHSV